MAFRISRGVWQFLDTRTGSYVSRYKIDTDGVLKETDDAGAVIRAVGGEVDWSAISNIPSTFTPSAHTHTIANVTGLQAALDGKQAAGSYVLQLSNTSSPNYQDPSSRRVDPNASNPTNEHYAITTFGNGGNVTGQLATHFVNGQLYSRGYNSSWSAWRKVWDSVNFDPNSKANSSHTHTIANVTGLQAALDGKQAAGSYLTTSGKAADSNLLDGIDSSGFQRQIDESIVNIGSPNASSGTWITADADDWGTPRIGSIAARYNDGTGHLQFNVPAGMDSAYISHLTWSSGGYVDCYGVQADGGLVFLRRINTRQSIENSNEGSNGGNPNQHDGTTISLVGTGLSSFSAIRLQNRVGRFHLTGMSFTSAKLQGTEGTGMVHPGQLSVSGSGSGLDADLLDGNHASAFAAASHTHSIANVTGLQAALDDKQVRGDYASASHTHAISEVTGLQTALDGKQASGSYAASNHNHTYNVNDQWLRENGDNAHFKIYANTRQLVFRTDGTAEYNTGVGGYPFVWMYGGDAASNRRMLMDTSGNLWTNAYGWLHDYFQRAGSYAAASHTHTIANVTGLQAALDGKQAAGSYAAASHEHDRTFITDSRGAARTPGFYDDRYAQWDFQNASDTGAGGDSWHGLLTVSKWTVYHDSHRQEQLAFTGNDLKRRTATSDSAWGGWKTILDSSNFSAWAQPAGSYAAASHTHSIANVTGLQAALDGKQAAGSYLTTSGKAADSELIDGIDSSRIVFGSGPSKVSSHSNANERRDSGFYENDGGGSNWPSATWYNSINVRHSNQGNYHGFQIAMSYYDNNLWFRSYQGSGTFQSWAYAISSQNIGSQRVDYANTAGSAPANGGNSNTVAGLAVHGGRNNEANKVVRTDGNGYIQAGWINTTSGARTSSTAPVRITASNDEYLRYYSLEDFKVALGLPRSSYNRHINYSATAGYHTGVMGHSNTYDVFNRLPHFGSGFIDFWSSAPNAPDSNHWVGVQSWHAVNWQGVAGRNYGWQLVHRGGTAGDIRFNSQWGDSDYGWITIWNSANDGAGSGLDADLLDGNHASAFALASHTHTIGQVTGLQAALDGKQASGSYASSDHGHTGLSSNEWGGLTSRTGSGYIDFGPANTSWAHIYTDRPAFYFNKDLYVNNAKMATESYVTSRGYASANGSYGTDFYVNALYYDDWVRNHTNSNGMYWSTTGWHLYPINGAYFRIRSGNTSTSGLRFMTGSTDRNYLHCNSSNEIGFLNASGSWALRVDNSGNTTATGDVTAFSDVRLKENIKPISGALDKVLSLQGVYYNRIDIEDKSTKIGFIAQDVKHIVPEVVQISSDELSGIEDRHSVDYGKLVALLTEAIKEQQAQINELKAKLDAFTK